MQQLFMQFDKDNSGVISIDAIPVLMAHIGGCPNLTKDQVKEMLKHVDLDDNNCIEYVEFLDWW